MSDGFFIDPALHHGAPEDLAARLEKEQACYALLSALGIDFWRADHDPADTIVACEDVERVLGVGVCKNLFLCNRQQTQFYLLMMPGHKPFKTKDITYQLGCARLSFAGPELLLERLHLTPGSVSLLGLMYDPQNLVQLVLDSEVYHSDFIRCHPCINTSTLKIATRDVLEKLLPHLHHEPIVVTLPDRTGE